MKISKYRLRKIVQEQLDETLGYDVEFDWDPAGLSMIMYVHGKETLTFGTQKEVRSLISKLEGLLTGPMRTSP